MSSIIAKPLPVTVVSMVRFLRRRPLAQRAVAARVRLSPGLRGAGRGPALHYQPSLLGHGEGTLLS